MRATCIICSSPPHSVALLLHLQYNYRVPDEVLAQYLQALLPGLGAYRPFDLVSVVHSCVVMNHQPRWGTCVGL